jgi:polyhydroxybutyrate depolymerase
MTERPVAALAALAAVLAACGSDGAGAQGQAAPECPPRVAGAQLRMPDGARAGETALLVVVMPGGDGDSSDRLGLARAANRAGIAVLYPTGDGFWTLNDEQGTSDVENVRALLDRVLGSGCFDRARVSITGVSNGAGFATRMACEDPERFAAVVPVAAGFRALDPCPARARASYLAIHGTGDTVVPYNGKKPDRAGSVPRFTARWARRVGCSSGPRVTRPRARVTRYAYRGCDGGRRVELVRLTGTEHGWPGRRGRNPSGFQATPEVVRFVRAATSSTRTR